MSFIEFKYNKNLNYAIIYWIVELILRGLIYLYWELFHVFEKDSINEYFYLILLNISDLLAVFLVIYIHCSLKQKNTDDYSEISSKKSKYELISEEKWLHFYTTKNFIFKMILICVLDYINRLPFFIFYQSNLQSKHDDISHKAQFDIINHVDIITRFLLSIIVFKTKLFKHHIFSFFIILIGFIIIIPTDAISLHFFPNGVDEKLTYIYIGVFTIRGILYPVEDVIEKKVFMENYILPEHLMVIRGVGELFIVIIITPILYFTLWINEENCFALATDITKMIILIVIYIIGSFIKAYVLLKLIYYFSMQAVSFLIISESITGSITEIVEFFKSVNSDPFNIVFLLIDVIIIFLTAFGTFVYNEILIIKKWGLDKNVASKIASRAITEVHTINILDQGDDVIDEEDIEGEKKMIELKEVYE